jgi:hypothetical protein
MMTQHNTALRGPLDAIWIRGYWWVMDEEILQRLVTAIYREAAATAKWELAENGDTLTQYAKRRGREAKEDLLLRQVDVVVQRIVAGTKS